MKEAHKNNVSASEMADLAPESLEPILKKPMPRKLVCIDSYRCNHSCCCSFCFRYNWCNQPIWF